jgi:hypothetical protein
MKGQQMPKVQLRQRQTMKTKGRSSAGMQIMGAAAKPAQLRHPLHQTRIRNDRCEMIGDRPGEAGRDRPQRSRTPPGAQLTPGAATIIESACPTFTQVPNMRSQSQEDRTRDTGNRLPKGSQQEPWHTETTTAVICRQASHALRSSTWNQRLRRQRASFSGSAANGTAIVAESKSVAARTFASTACRTDTKAGSAQHHSRIATQPRQSMTATSPAGPLSGKAAGGHGDAATPEAKGKAGAETRPAPAIKSTKGSGRQTLLTALAHEERRVNR